MSVAANFIGFAVTGIFGAVTLLDHIGGKPPKDLITTVRIQLGQNGTFGASLGGDLPSVSLWDEFGQSIGSSAGGQIKEGNFKDIEIVAHSDIGNVPVEYVSISAGGDDAVCVAFITVTQSSGDASTFAGDIGKQCGATWFESTIPLGTGGAHPACMWIDQNGSDGLQDQGFGFHLRDFFGTDAQGAAYANNPDLLCKSGPRFRMYPKVKVTDSILFYDPPLQFNQDGTDVDPLKVINNPGNLTQPDDPQQRALCMDPAVRPLQPCEVCAVFPLPGVACNDKLTRRDVMHSGVNTTRLFPSNSADDKNPESASAATTQAGGRHNGTSSWRFEGALVISDIPVHSAANLCASASSYGPDFVAMREGKFCDMKYKHLWDVCASAESKCCFDVKQKQLRPCAGHRRRGMKWRQVASASDASEYTNVQYW